MHKSTRDGLLQVSADVLDAGDGAVRVTVVEMVGERGYLERRMSAARSLAKRAVYMTGPTKAEPVHFCNGQGRVTFLIRPHR